MDGTLLTFLASYWKILIKGKRRARMYTKFTLTMITLILAMALAMVTLAGCNTSILLNPNSNEGTDNSQSNPSDPSTDATDTDNYQMLPVISGKVANLKLDASADGTTQQLKKGEVLSITLESNPSTGYSWFATVSNQAVLLQMGEPEYQAPAFDTATPIVGASGAETFFFQAANAGSATLTLEYMRSFEKDVNPEKTITITIEVK
jgi:inhibitor of cysteine peptidase